MNAIAPMPASRRRVQPWARRVGSPISIVLVWVGALICIAPLLYVIIQSFTSPSRGPYRRPALLMYESVLQSERLWTAFKNTGIQELIILSTTLFFCPLAGYGFAKFRFHGKNFLFSVMVLTLFFTPIAQLIPLLLEMNDLGWLDTYQGLVMPLAISSLGIFWMTLAIRGVPDEILNAARLDGCGSFSVWWRIVMPAVKPALLTLAFFTFLTAYNDYVWPLLVLPSDSMQTIQIFLQAGGGGYGGGGASMPTLVITSLPTIVIFMVMQHYFMPEMFKNSNAPRPIADDDFFHSALSPAAPAPAALPAMAVAAVPEHRSVWSLPSDRPAWSALLAVAGLRPWLAARTARLTHCALIVACTIIVYLNALQNSLHLDDVYRVTGNSGVEKLWPIWRHFTDPYTSASIPTDAQFRPLLPLSLSIDHALTGNSLLGYHLGNLLLDAVAGIAVYVLARELLGHWTAKPLPPYRADFLALAVALLVAVHPVAGFLVSYVSGRDLLLMQIFIASSLFVYIRMRRPSFYGERTRMQHEPLVKRRLYYWFGNALLGWVAALALFELALLAKTQAVMAPALILAFELTLGRGTPARLAPYVRALPFALVALGHLAYIDSYLNFTALPDSPNITADAGWTYPLTQARLSILHYLPNFAWPFNMHQIPVEPTANGLQDPGVLIGLAFIAMTVLCAWILRRRNPLMAFCIVAYWLAQSPESSIQPMLHNAADYRPYPAAPFLFLVPALLLDRFLRPARASIVLLALVLFFGGASLYMNATW